MPVTQSGYIKVLKWFSSITIAHATSSSPAANLKVHTMTSFIAVCLSRPMTLEVAEVLGLLGFAVLFILAVGIAGKRASE